METSATTIVVPPTAEEQRIASIADSINLADPSLTVTYGTEAMQGISRGPPSKDDGGRTADGEAEHAAWKTSDDYGQKGIYVSLCLLLGKKANNFCVSPFWGDTRMPLSESHLIVF